MQLADVIGGHKTRAEWSSDVLSRALERQSLRVNEVNASPYFIAEASEQSDSIVVVTDGYPSSTFRSNLDSLMLSKNYLVFCGLIPKQKLSPDISVDYVEIPSTLSVGIPALFTVTVRGLNIQGKETLLTVSDSAGVLASRRVNFSSIDQTQSMTLSVTEPVSGLARFIVKATPVDQEVNVANNEYRVSALVEDHVTKVLLFESQPSWDAKFLRRSLDNNATVKVDYFAQVSRAATVSQPTEGA